MRGYMTLRDIIRMIEGTAMSRPEIGTIIRQDVFHLNELPDARYGVFAWQQGVHNDRNDGGEISYRFTLFYVDRLAEGRRNEIEVQSAALVSLGGILRTLSEDGALGLADGWMFTTFAQRFSDLCAGAYAEVTVTASPDALCPDMFGDYNDDFNEDYDKGILTRK